MKRRRMMCDHELGYYDTYEATDSLSLEEMIESDMRQQQSHDCDDATANNNNNSHNHNHQHQPQLWVHCAHTSSDASIDFDTSVLLVNPQTGTPVLHAHSPNDSHQAYILVNPDMMENTVESPNLAKENRQHTRFVSTSSSSSSSTSSSSSEDEDTAAEDGEEVRPGEHVLHLHSTVGLSTSVKHYPKPIYSYSCLIAMALKNSETGCLPVSEIYNFMIRNYPYFKTAPNGWKNSVRHNLSLNKCFAKVDKPSGKQRKGCLWTMNPDRIEKMDDEVFKWSQKDPVGIQQSMAKPEDFGVLEKFCDKHERQMEDIRLELANPTVNHVKTVHNTPSIQQQQQKSVKSEVEPMKEEVESEVNLDNSLLDSTYHVDFWGELEEKLEFDIPLTLEHHLPTTCNQTRTVKVKL